MLPRNRLPLALTLACAFVILVVPPAPASAAWQQVVGGASPVNYGPTTSATDMDATTVGGTPYLSWVEHNGSNYTVRVARLGGDQSDWPEPVAEAAPINSDMFQQVCYYEWICSTSIVDFGGRPCVAWSEFDGTNYELRVARLNSTGTAWDPVGESVAPNSPINHESNRDAYHPSLVVIDGVLYVAWREKGTLDVNWEVRVAAYNAVGDSWTEVVGGESPINASTSRDAKHGPELTAFNSRPAVVWTENDGGNDEARVSILNATGDDWVEPVGGASPVNFSSTKDSSNPSIVTSGGKLYVAWEEYDGSYWQVRAARLNDAGTAWIEDVGGARPINFSAYAHGSEPDLADLGGLPLITWWEGDGADDEIRVARLTSDRTDWVEIVGGASPINESSIADARGPELAIVGGVPYVFWGEYDGVNMEGRVSRLVPSFDTAFTNVNGGTGAALTAVINTFGIALPTRFEYAQGTSLTGPVSTVDATIDSTGAYARTTLTGLSPATTYAWRLIGTDTFRTTATGPTQTFTTGPRLSMKFVRKPKPRLRSGVLRFFMRSNYSVNMRVKLKQGRRTVGLLIRHFEKGKRRVVMGFNKGKPRGGKPLVAYVTAKADDNQSIKLKVRFSRKLLPKGR